ncbi:MAG: Lar family restriction alleviation protein [Acidaminococcaceae bacterium]|nr:Lar family restriction alleviation protein [Acidaminococcaceae bacterium]
MGKGNYICFYDTNRRRPCPECGSEDLTYASTRYDRKRNALNVYIKCRGCGCKSHVHKTVEDALKEWNG